MTAVAEVFHALGDDVRLQMLQRLVHAQPCSMAELSRGLGITRQGARKHLQVLADARLVTLEPQGREIHVRLESCAIDRAQAFLKKLERQWDGRLEALKRSLEGDR